MQRELASRSAHSMHRVSDRPGHNLQMPRPELVVEGIGHVVEQVRSRPWPHMHEEADSERHSV